MHVPKVGKTDKIGHICVGKTDKMYYYAVIILFYGQKWAVFRYYGYFMKNRNKGMDYITHT